MYCEINACWIIFLQMFVKEQQNDANITVITALVFNCATVRNVLV